MTSNNALKQLSKSMVAAFNLNDIRELCFELNVQYESLGENLNIQTRIIAFIEYLHQRQRLPELVELLRRKRPAISWPDASELASLDVQASLAQSPPTNTPPTFNISGDINAGNVNLGGQQTFEEGIHIDMRRINKKPPSDDKFGKKETG